MDRATARLGALDRSTCARLALRRGFEAALAAGRELGEDGATEYALRRRRSLAL
jgi:hypothetical protein